MKKIIKATLSCLMCLLVVSPILAKQRKSPRIQITGMYSSMYYVEEAGDIVGMEIFIVSSRDGYYATVQIAEGVADIPVITKVEVKGTNVEFSLPSTSGINLGKFRGRISVRGLTGRFEGEIKARFLKRKSSYWQ